MKRKTAITECGYSWGDFAPTHTINPWLGCAFNCDYCWARDWWWRRMKGPLGKAWGVPDGFEWHKPIIFEGIVEQVENELLTRRWPANTRILLCSMTDPYIPGGPAMQVMTGILEHLENANIPMMILTKAPVIPSRDFDALKNMDAWFGVTLDKGVAGAYRLKERAKLLERAHIGGIKTFVSLEPWMPGQYLTGLIWHLKGVVDHWIVGRLNYKGVDCEFYRENLENLIIVLERTGNSFYIKPDLMRCLEDG